MQCDPFMPTVHPHHNSFQFSFRDVLGVAACALDRTMDRLKEVDLRSARHVRLQSAQRSAKWSTERKHVARVAKHDPSTYSTDAACFQ